MPKINQEEYEVLKNYNFIGVKWISRNENGNLVISKVKPDKIRGKWLPNCPDEDWSELRNSHNNLFHFIQSEDREPYSIAELIEEYEYSADHVSHVVNERVKALGNAWNESEETEVKNIEWLKKEIKFDKDTSYPNYISKRRVYNLLDQLDEPEVLSQEWVSDNAVVGQYPDGMGYVVPAYKLQNLLVTKQEEVKVPQSVADWIEECKGWDDDEQDYDDDNAIDLFNAMDLDNAGMQDNVHDYLVDNTETFARAWLDGYTVEEEQKYYARIKGWELFVDFVGAQYWGVVSNYGRLCFVNVDGAKDRTKDEWRRLGINDTNADFVRVEELEE